VMAAEVGDIGVVAIAVMIQYCYAHMALEVKPRSNWMVESTLECQTKSGFTKRATYADLFRQSDRV
jgi:hypothetical protein